MGRRSVRFQKPRWLKNASTWMPKLRMPWPGPSYRHKLQDRTGHGDTTTLAHTVAVAAEKVSNQTGHAGFLGHHEDLIFETTGPVGSLDVGWCYFDADLSCELMLFFFGSYIRVVLQGLSVKIRKHLFKGRCEDPSPVPHGWDEHGCSASKTFLRYRLPTFSLLEISYHV